MPAEAGPLPDVLVSDDAVVRAVRAMWARARPDDPAVCIAFYRVDKGWWRMLAAPGRFYDFYADGRNVGEGPKKERDWGFNTSVARVVPGLEGIETLGVAVLACGQVVGLDLSPPDLQGYLAAGLLSSPPPAGR